MPKEIREIQTDFKEKHGDLILDNIELRQRMRKLEKQVGDHQKFLSDLLNLQANEKIREKWEEIKQSDLDEQKEREQILRDEKFTSENKEQIKRAKKRLKKIKQKKKEKP
jgi:hypothetical protein